MQVEGAVQKIHWQRASSGDLEAWVRLYGDKLLSIAYSLLRDEHLAKDCVQETFIKACLKAGQLRDSDRAFVWLSRIVVNECRSQQRTPWRKRIVPKDSIEEAGREDVYPSERDPQVYDCVMELPEKWKLAVLLHYYQDLPVADVASILKTNESTCKVWLHRARLKLRDLIGEDRS